MKSEFVKPPSYHKHKYLIGSLLVVKESTARNQARLARVHTQFISQINHALLLYTEQQTGEFNRQR